MSEYMNGNIKNYLEGLAGILPAEIISERTYRGISKLADLFHDFAASEYIMETYLNSEAAEADFSYRVLTKEKACFLNGLKSHAFSTLADDWVWRRIIAFADFWPADIPDIWLEMDYGEYDKQIPQPCFFFNASRIKKGTDVDERLLFKALQQLLDIEQLELLWSKLRGVIQQLPPEVGLFQAGIMLARNSDRVRIFTAELTREQTGQYLSNIGWAGTFSELEGLFKLVHPYSDGRYIVDFDVSSEGISEKIGINFGLDKKETLPDFLENLLNHQLCTDRKGRGVMAWPGSKGHYLGPDYGYAVLVKDISHFKISCSPEEGLKAKAYLRAAGIYLKELFKNPVTFLRQSAEREPQAEQPGFKEMQNIFKQISQRSMLDKEYRDLCLNDSKAALQEIIKKDIKIPDNIIFLEEDGDGLNHDGVSFILPPFLKPSWLTK